MPYVYRKVQVSTATHRGTYISIADKTTFDPEVITSAFLVSLQQSGLSLKTIEKYASTIVHFLNAVYASSSVDKDWTNIKDQHLSAYQETRAYELAPGTHTIVISNLKALFDWCFEYGWLDNPLGYSWKLPYEKQREIKEYRAEVKSRDPFNLFARYISKSDFDYLLTFNPRKKSFERVRDEIILKLGYYSGLRRAETVDPVNISLTKIKRAISEASKAGLEGFEITIIGKGKDGGKSRTVYIPPSLRRQIESFIRNELKRKAPNSDLLICRVENGAVSPLSEEHATSLFREAKAKLLEKGDVNLIRAWVKNERTRTFHALRHSYATNFADEIIRGDADLDLLQERMGHEHYDTTKIYLWFAAKRSGDQRMAQKYAGSLKARNGEIERESQGDI